MNQSGTEYSGVFTCQTEQAETKHSFISKEHVGYFMSVTLTVRSALSAVPVPRIKLILQIVHDSSTTFTLVLFMTVIHAFILKYPTFLYSLDVDPLYF